MFNYIPLKQVCQPLVSVAGTFYVENIIDGFMEQGSFGRISQFIVHFLAGAATGKQAGLFEQPKMMRNGGRTHVDGNGNIVDAFFAVAEQPKNFKARWIADKGESVGNFVKSGFRRHMSQHMFGIVMVAVKTGVHCFSLSGVWYPGFLIRYLNKKRRKAYFYISGADRETRTPDPLITNQ